MGILMVFVCMAVFASATSVTMTTPTITNGAGTSTSPVAVKANATSANSITSWQILVDGVSVYNWASYKSYLNTSLAVSAGTHTVQVKATDSKGYYGTQSFKLTVTTATTTTTTYPALLGFYNGNDMAAEKDAEAWQGKRNGAVMFFYSFCSGGNPFSGTAPAIWSNHNVPIMTWEPYDCYGSGHVNNDITYGKYDTKINTVASNMKKWLAGPDGVYGNADDRRLFIRLAHEMNGTWYPWGGKPSEYIQMFRHVHQLLTNQGIDSNHVQFMFVVNCSDHAGKAEDYYPGDAYADWVGVDGYNWAGGNWMTPAQIFDSMISRLKVFGKAIAVPETGSASWADSTLTTVDLARKNQWITSMYQYIVTKGVSLVTYFDREPSTKQDWGIFGGSRGTGTYTNPSGKTYKIFSNYRTAVQNSLFETTDLSNPRLISDRQFFGK